MKSAIIRALVTGGAGGIGGAIAAELLDRGGAVLLVDRDVAALDRAVGRLARYGDRVGILPIVRIARCDDHQAREAHRLDGARRGTDVRGKRRLHEDEADTGEKQGVGGETGHGEHDRLKCVVQSNRDGGPAARAPPCTRCSTRP